MTQRFRIFLVVLLLMFTVNFFGQNIPQNICNGITTQEIITRFKIKSQIYDAIKNKPGFMLIANTCLIENTIANNSKITLPRYYLKSNVVLSEGVLCRAEYKFQKATTIPLRLRLGSLDYTNYLEQKPNALKPD